RVLDRGAATRDRCESFIAFSWGAIGDRRGHSRKDLEPYAADPEQSLFHVWQRTQSAVKRNGHSEATPIISWTSVPSTAMPAKCNCAEIGRTSISRSKISFISASLISFVSRSLRSYKNPTSSAAYCN